MSNFPGLNSHPVKVNSMRASCCTTLEPSQITILLQPDKGWHAIHSIQDTVACWKPQNLMGVWILFWLQLPSRKAEISFYAYQTKERQPKERPGGNKQRAFLICLNPCWFGKKWFNRAAP